MENCADYLAGNKPEAPMWSSSSTRDIERFIASQGARNDSQYDDDESIAVEIVRTITFKVWLAITCLNARVRLSGSLRYITMSN